MLYDSDEILKGLSSADLKLFKEGDEWKAITSILEERVELFRDQLEQGYATIVGDNKESVIAPFKFEDYKTRVGGLKQLRYVLSLLDGLIEDKEQQESKGE